jgi:hypothetical protein
MGVSCDAWMLYGIRFSFDQLKGLYTNPIVVQKLGDCFMDSLDQFWRGEFEGVYLFSPSGPYERNVKYAEFYVAALLDDFAHLSRKDFLKILNDEEIIKKLKGFCMKFGLKYTEPEVYCVPNVYC